jgi:arylsulfatase A-like enzyme
MNLIFITIDGAREDRIVTGNFFKKLISNNSFFPKVITNAPFTIAAMHAVFSGVYGFKNGVNSYWSSPNFKKNLFKTLPRYMHDHNYVTYGDSINKLILPPDGFDELKIHDELHDNLTERHKLLLEKMSNEKKLGKNFFLYLHYSNIHTGIMENVLKPYDNFSTEYFSNKKKNSEYYDKLFSDADTYLKEIYHHFQNLGLEQDTLLVVISDHGISIGEKIGERAYGVFCYDTTLISTALFCHPKLDSTTFQKQVRSVDILPTILEILSIPFDKNFENIDGKSLVPLINGRDESRIAFSQSGNPLDSGKPPKEPNVYSIRTDEWKYIRNIHDSTEELYHLVKDPDENSNLISQETKKSVEMSHLMDELLNQKTQ